MIFNPEIVESDGEWVYDEGCLSIPGLYVEMVRPKKVLIRGVDLDGNEVEIEADELEARMFQHELDHLHGVLMFDRMTPEQRKEAMAEYRRLQREPPAEPAEAPAPPAPALTRRHARLVFLGTPEMAVPAAAGAGRRRARGRPGRHPRRQAPRPRERDFAEPGEGGRDRARPAGQSTHVDDVLDASAPTSVSSSPSGG